MTFLAPPFPLLRFAQAAWEEHRAFGVVSSTSPGRKLILMENVEAFTDPQTSKVQTLSVSNVRRSLAK